MANMDIADRLLATLRTRIPGVTENLLNLELFNTIDEFFRKSSAWRWETVVPLIFNTMEYPIFPPGGTDLVQVLGVQYKGSPVPPESADGAVVSQRGRIVGTTLPPDYDALFAPTETLSPGGVFRYSIFFPQFLTIDIPPSADAAQFPFNVLLALTLNYQCLEDSPNEWPLEEWMYSTFAEAWIDGVQGRFMSQIGKPWTNSAMGAYHARRFRGAMARAKQTAARGYVYNVPNWRFPRWA